LSLFDKETKIIYAKGLFHSSANALEQGSFNERYEEEGLIFLMGDHFALRLGTSPSTKKPCPFVVVK
jgi:hypothetical protein